MPLKSVDSLIKRVNILSRRHSDYGAIFFVIGGIQILT